MPDWKQEIRHRLANLNLEPAREDEIVEELSQHLEDRYKESLARGASPEDAHRAALAELSDGEMLAHDLRRVERQVIHEPVVLGARRINMIADLWQDFRYAARGLRKHALLSTVVIATLALGIGVSAGVFGFFNAIMLRALVNKDFDSFVRVYSAYTTNPTRPGRPRDTTLEDYLAYRDQVKSLGDLAAWAQFDAPLGQDDPVEVRVALVTSNFFTLYNLEQPLMGRLLQPADCSAANPVVVVSESLWRKRLASDPQIIGKAVHFNGQPVTVVGVAPTFAGMLDVNGASAWFPYTLETYLKMGDNLPRPAETPWLFVAGRLNPGFSRQDAAAELKLLASQQSRLRPGRTTMVTVTDGSMIQDPYWGDKTLLGLSLVLGALTILVLIVCVNVTTLLLARAAARRKEIAVRLALGASRVRLVRMLLVETYLLASMASLLGVYFVYHVPGALIRWLRPQPEWQETFPWSLVPDWRVFGYLTLLTVLAGTTAGLTPALQSMKVNLSEMLNGGRSMLGGAARGSRLYSLLIGAQVALSFFLLVFACVSIRAYQKASTIDPGFETRQVVWADLIMRSRSDEQRNWGAFHRTLTERLVALPGAQSVAYSDRHPFRAPEITVQAPSLAPRQVNSVSVSPNYFTTLGIPIVSGRAIRDDDPPCGQTSGNVSRNYGCSVVVSQRLAREFWPGSNPLGQTLRTPQGNSFEVVGVARDISRTRLGRLDDPMIYRPMNLNGAYPKGYEAYAFVRFSGDGVLLSRAVCTTIREMAPDLSVSAETIQSFRDSEIAGLWRIGRIIVFIVALAVTLAVIGIYGVVAFAVARRNKELGIRIALGAGKIDIYRAVLSFSVRPVAVGLLIGLVTTLGTTSTIAQTFRDGMFGEFTMYVQDPITYTIAAILLAAAAFAAMLVPARRATRVDPMSALREE